MRKADGFLFIKGIRAIIPKKQDGRKAQKYPRCRFYKPSRHMFRSGLIKEVLKMLKKEQLNPGS